MILLWPAAELPDSILLVVRFQKIVAEPCLTILAVLLEKRLSVLASQDLALIYLLPALMIVHDFLAWKTALVHHQSAYSTYST